MAHNLSQLELAARLWGDAMALAALLHSRDHWVQGRDLRHDYIDGQLFQRWCLRGGAITVTTTGRVRDPFAERSDALIRLVQWVIGPCDDVVQWNDNPRRTHADVCVLLAQVVAEARSRLEALDPPPVDGFIPDTEDLYREQDTQARQPVTIGPP